jgi:N-acyl-L-homoserine lactone synthetase
MGIKAAKDEYLEKATNLSEEETERLLSRMGGKLPRRLDKNKISKLDALAMQLEIEDDQLAEWREKMREITAKNKKNDVKSKA